MKSDELEKLLSNLVKWLITVGNRSLSNILCACWHTNLYFHVLLKTGKQKNKPSKTSFSCWYNFFLAPESYSVFLRKKPHPGILVWVSKHMPMKMLLKQLLWPKFCLFQRNTVMLPKMLFSLFIRYGFLKLRIAQSCSSFK